MQRILKIVGPVVIVVVLLVGAGLWWFFKGDALDEVSLDTAAEQVADTSSSDAATAGEGDGITGTWTVDTDTGEFDYESATGSFVGFRIEEVLNSIGSTTAVGRTGDVAGTLTFGGTTVTVATFDVDLTTITTNESRRDDNVQEILETTEFPTALFALTEPIELGEAATTGEAVAVTATGELTIHGVTQSVQIDLEAQLVADTVVVVGSMDIAFADYGVEVPSSPAIVSVEDHGTLELQLLLTRQ
ncbi:MAG: YceI family protein [Actinomycetia bacterium]|nr:YceI family protein [Actinomycetes bacterium]